MQARLSEIRHLIPDDLDYRDHRDLEMFKEIGRELQRTASDLAERSRGVLVEIYCHFHRSRNAALSSRRKHPEFEEYAVHWLYSDPESHSRPEHIVLMGNVERPRELKIARGESFWRYRKPKL